LCLFWNHNYIIHLHLFQFFFPVRIHDLWYFIEIFFTTTKFYYRNCVCIIFSGFWYKYH
jgi:hypothetical protein